MYITNMSKTRDKKLGQFLAKLYAIDRAKNNKDK
jgi:hypothetical protein